MDDSMEYIEVSHSWLTAKTAVGSHELILIAEPAPSKKKRELKVLGIFGPEYAYIDIIQKK